MKLVSFVYNKDSGSQMYFIADPKIEGNTYITGHDLKENFQFKRFLHVRVSHYKDLNIEVYEGDYVVDKEKLVELATGQKVAPEVVRLLNINLLLDEVELKNKCNIFGLIDGYYLVKPRAASKKPTLYTWTYNPTTQEFLVKIDFSDGTNHTEKVNDSMALNIMSCLDVK